MEKEALDYVELEVLRACNTALSGPVGPVVQNLQRRPTAKL
jgi:hypothetical protein